MRLTPLDIKKQEFDRVFRGFDVEETRAFLDMVAQQWQDVLDDQRRLEDRVRELEGKLDHYQKVEEALQEALETARSSTQQRLENANDRADVIVQEARAEARHITRDAHEERERLARETEQLTGRRNEVVARLRAFLNSEMELLSRFTREPSPEVLEDEEVQLDPVRPPRAERPTVREPEAEPEPKPSDEHEATDADVAEEHREEEARDEGTVRAPWRVQSVVDESVADDDEPSASETVAEGDEPHEPAPVEDPVAVEDDDEQSRPASERQPSEWEADEERETSDELDKIRRILSDLD